MKTESYLAELYVELTTRKLALPFNEDSDCIYEIYNSWFKFFSFCREQMKKIAKDDPEVCSYDHIKSIKVGSEAYFYYKKSMEIMRPHLENYSYDFRIWWDNYCCDADVGYKILPHKKIQEKYENYQKIIDEINKIITNYKDMAIEIAELLSFKDNGGNYVS